MADSKADRVQSEGAEISDSPDAINFADGLDATQSNGVVEVGIKADGVTNAKIADDAVSLEHLDSGITPSHIVVAAGQHTTAGGDTAEQATVAGVVATDIVICSLEDNGTNDSTLISGAAGAGVIDFVLNEDPGTDVIINYMVLRAVS
jgi:hypothetical protein